MEDSQIIDLYFARSEQAIQETQNRYGKFCYKIAWNILTNQEDTQECVNDTYLTVWRSIPPTRPSCLPAYLGKITRHIALDRWRRCRAEKRGGGEPQLALEELADCIPARDSAEDALLQKELSRALNAFLEGLPQGQRQLFVSRYWYLRSVAQLAEATGQSQSNVKTQLFRIRVRLKKYLEQEGIL